jgi:hypothetical protein
MTEARTMVRPLPPNQRRVGNQAGRISRSKASLPWPCSTSAQSDCFILRTLSGRALTPEKGRMGLSSSQ